MTALIIALTCFILYKSGAVRWFLSKIETSGHPEPYREPPENREKWEKEAYYILAKQGLVNPETVRYMGDEMLIHIVRDYLEI
jgi:hypothetical protein